MARRHGWQLPADTLQMVAITVYFLLVVAYHAFLAPFLGSNFLQYIAVAVYAPAALAVFVLYVRCTSINPADAGIMLKFDNERINLPVPRNDGELQGADSSSSACTSAADGRPKQKPHAMPDMSLNGSFRPPNRTSLCHYLGGIFCGLFFMKDCRNSDESEQGIGEEDALFCTLCNVEVGKFSKHCRSCDKCVDGFDHHCRWLNNCVGRNNYISFFILMACSLLWLAVEFGVGVAVLVLCFVHKQQTEALIVEKLGNGFSRAPFAAVVGICTAVSLLACVFLGELFFFHIILIKKGITTYEYVVAMRAMSEAPAAASVDDERPHTAHSPTNSATTGLSGGSSFGLGLQYRGVWCTPPRVFVDQQDEVVTHLEPGMVPSTVDPDAAGRASKSKKPVKLSAWKLAKLDAHEALRFAADARESSTVLRPVAKRKNAADMDAVSIGTASVRTSTSMEYRATNDSRSDLRLSSNHNSYAPSAASGDDYDSITQTASSLSSPAHAFGPPAVPRATHQRLPPLASRPTHVLMTSSVYALDTQKSSVMWDQEAGRYVSVSASTNFGNHSGESSSYARRPRSGSSSSVILPMRQYDERSTHSGHSVFSGRSLPSIPPLGSIRMTEGYTRARDPQAHRQEVFSVRGRTADSFPLFVPGSSQADGPFFPM